MWEGKVDLMAPAMSEDAFEEDEQRGKYHGKNIRQPIDVERADGNMSNSERQRMAVGRQQRLSLDFYINHSDYVGKTLFWELDQDGKVERWLHLGASLVPRMSKTIGHWKGFTDRLENEWECIPVGEKVGGGTLMQYALSLPDDEYFNLRIKPMQERNAEIQRAMGVGVEQGEAVMPEATGIRTYSPELTEGSHRYKEAPPSRPAK